MDKSEWVKLKNIIMLFPSIRKYSNLPVFVELNMYSKLYR